MAEHHVAPASRDERFSELFKESYGLVLAFVRRRVPSSQAQDVAAQTFLKAWRQFDELSGEPLLWLYRLARGEIANHRRGLIRRQRLGDRVRLLARDVVAPDHAEAVAETDRYAAAFRLLRESDREVLRLVAWEGLDTSSAASVVGCSPAAFKVRLHRARRRLSINLGRENPVNELEAPRRAES